ncbi:hypothetical protein N2152v2_005255 [Parachlorella kessleri]
MGDKEVALERTVPPLEGPLRLDHALLRVWPEQFPTLTRSKRTVRKGQLLVQGEQASTTTEVRGGELVQWVQPSSGKAMDARRDALGPTLPLVRVVYEDDHLACVVKPQGMPMDGGRGERIVLAHCLPRMLQPSKAVGALRQPRYAHRLDEATGGLVLAAKTMAALRALGAAFAERRITKRYRALAWGRLEGRGLVRCALDGKASETEYLAVAHSRVRVFDGGSSPSPGSQEDSKAGGSGSSLVDEPGVVPQQQSETANTTSSASGAGSSERQGSASGQAGVAPCGKQHVSASATPLQWVTSLDLWPHTGRTHQLRRHLALIGHPLVGDRKYTHGYAKQRVECGAGLAAEDHLRLPPAGLSCSQATGGVEAAGQQAVTGAEPGLAPGMGQEAQQQCSRERGEGGDRAAGAVLPLEGVLVERQQHKQTEHLEASVSIPLEGGAAGLPLEVAAKKQGVTAGYAAPAMCLWAVQLDLVHPISGEPLHFQLEEPGLFAEVRRELATGKLLM